MNMNTSTLLQLMTTNTKMSKNMNTSIRIPRSLTNIPMHTARKAMTMSMCIQLIRMNTNTGMLRTKNSSMIMPTNTSMSIRDRIYGHRDG